MKKLFVTAVCVVLALALAACGGQSANNDPKDGQEQTETLGGMQIPNPFTDCATLGEAEQLAGFDISLPGSMPEGYSISAIRVMKDEMIEIIYTSGSGEIRIRKGTGSEDISGDYGDYANTETVMVDGLQVTIKGSGNNISVASWLSGGYAFSITAEAGLGETAASDMVSAVK